MDDEPDEPDEEAMPTPLSSPALLELCDLPPLSSEDVRRTRLETLRSWARQHDYDVVDDDDESGGRRPSLIEFLTVHSHGMDTKTGCMPLHWLAGTGFNEAIDFVMSLLRPRHDDDDDNNGDDDDERKKKLFQFLSIIDQRAHKPSTDRTPLHYAARNGHLSTCALLIEKYGALSHPIAVGGVTPLQLAVWQNRLDVVKYLVTINGVHLVHERNGYDCGLAHWIGLIPKKRWRGDHHQVNNSNNNSNDFHKDDDVDNDGSGVLPLAQYLHSLGISYTSNPSNCNTQGHTPAHKAAWGGNLALLQYYHTVHGVYDTAQDVAGNYCADIARMRKNINCVAWLQECANGKRAESYAVLGLDGNTATEDDVRRRFIELAKASHPDSRGGRRRRSGEEHHQQQHPQDEENDDAHDDDIQREEMTENDEEFVKIRAAYEHLTKDGGVGNQRNPKYDEVKLLEDRRRITNNNDNNDDDLLILSSSDDGIDDDNNNNNGVIDDDDDLFMARLIAVISDYDENCGFPVALIGE